MLVFNIFDWKITTVSLLLGAVALSSGSDNENDLLDPSWDKPLPQYKSTLAPGFQERTVIPQATRPLPKIDAAEPGRIEADGSSVELAPNPLRKLSDGQEPAAVRPQPAKRVPSVKKMPAATAKPRATPPSYRSPFNPKPLSNRPLQKPRLQSGVNSLDSDLIKRPAVGHSENAAPPKAPTPPATRVASKSRPELNYDIYRDASTYPLDPRKPNNPCTKNFSGESCGCGSCLAKRTGFRGRPHQPREPGGYSCGKRCSNKHPKFSVYWPRPFSAKLDERHPERAAARYSGCPQKKLCDVFDKLANFRLIDYHRTDNGYFGPGCDPYGCLGESKVAGLGFRIPSVPNDPSNAYPLF